MAAAGTELRVFDDVEALSAAAARTLVEEGKSAILERGRFTLALAGGETPRTLYRTLAGEHRDELPWKDVHLFWSDERFVPSEHAESNVGAALALLLPLSIPAENVHAPDTTLSSLEDAARRYEEELLRFHPLDAVLLGIGEDGHVASLFPGAPALEETTRLVVPVHGASKPPSERITMTIPALNAARAVYFLVTGSTKREALKRVLEGADPLLPASRVRSKAGKVIFWADRAAAA
jgi:6-phosphogluconolactonase